MQDYLTLTPALTLIPILNHNSNWRQSEICSDVTATMKTSQASLMTENRILTHRVDVLIKDRDSLNGKLNGYYAQVVVLSDHAAALRMSSELASNTISGNLTSCHEKIFQLQKELSSANEKLEPINNENRHLSVCNDNCRARIATLEVENEQLQDELRVALWDKESLGIKLKEAEDIISERQMHLANTNTQVEILTNQVSYLEEKANVLKAEKERIEVKFEQQRTHLREFEVSTSFRGAGQKGISQQTLTQNNSDISNELGAQITELQDDVSFLLSDRAFVISEVMAIKQIAYLHNCV